MGFWFQNSFLVVGYRNYACSRCQSRIWGLGFVLGFLDNTNGGYCPNCSCYVDE